MGTNPVAVAVDTMTNKIYVANSTSNTVTVIDANNNYATATVNVGIEPKGAAVSDTGDAGDALVKLGPGGWPALSV